MGNGHVMHLWSTQDTHNTMRTMFGFLCYIHVKHKEWWQCSPKGHYIYSIGQEHEPVTSVILLRGQYINLHINRGEKKKLQWSVTVY